MIMATNESVTWAVKNGDLLSLKQIVEKGFNVNDEILGGRTAIHFAADYGQNDIIYYLLSKGAEINLPDKHGITALLSAIYEGHASTVKLLLSKGANKNLKSPSGESYKDCADCEEIRGLL